MDAAPRARRPRARAASRSAPRPTTDRTRPPAVRNVPSASRDVPAWKTSAPVAAASSSPSIASPRSRGVRVAGGRQHDAPTVGAGQGRQAAVGEAGSAHRRGEVAARGGQQERPERDRQARQDRLRLRVAEPGVALEEDGPVVGQHQAGVEGATERRPAPGQLGQDRPVEGLEQRRRPPRRTGPAAGCRRPSRRCSGRRRRRAGACGRGPAGARSPSARRRSR